MRGDMLHHDITCAAAARATSPEARGRHYSRFHRHRRRGGGGGLLAAELPHIYMRYIHIIGAFIFSFRGDICRYAAELAACR